MKSTAEKQQVKKRSGFRRSGGFVAVVAVVLAVGVLTGCSRSHPETATSTKAGASPSPAPTPRPQKPVYAQAVDVHFTMTDLKEQTVAVMAAKAPNYDPLSGSDALVAQNADAVLYEDGKPTTRLRAQNLHADRDTRILTATGNVRAESLSQKDTPAIRADRMVWKADSKRLTGDGKVLLTMKPDYQLPGRSFQADTKLNHFSVQQDERPGRGSL